jgi:hypothetical protein
MAPWRRHGPIPLKGMGPGVISVGRNSYSHSPPLLAHQTNKIVFTKAYYFGIITNFINEFFCTVELARQKNSTQLVKN